MPLAGGLPSGLISLACDQRAGCHAAGSSAPKPPAPPSGGPATGPAASEIGVGRLFISATALTHWRTANQPAAWRSARRWFRAIDTRTLNRAGRSTTHPSPPVPNPSRSHADSSPTAAIPRGLSPTRHYLNAFHIKFSLSPTIPIPPRHKRSSSNPALPHPPLRGGRGKAGTALPGDNWQYCRSLDESIIPVRSFIGSGWSWFIAACDPDAVCVVIADTVAASQGVRLTPLGVVLDGVSSLFAAGPPITRKIDSESMTSQFPPNFRAS